MKLGLIGAGNMASALARGIGDPVLVHDIDDAKARIQTGPGVPEWTWRSVSFGWNGPVQASQKVRPVLISLGLERLLTILRVVFILALAALLLNARQFGGRIFRSVPKAAALLVILAGALALTPTVRAEIPEESMLQTLRTRLLEVSDAFPNAAEIPTATLTINDRKITIDAEIHAATRAAVPLPGRLPAWLPVSDWPGWHLPSAWAARSARS